MDENLERPIEKKIEKMLVEMLMAEGEKSSITVDRKLVHAC